MWVHHSSDLISSHLNWTETTGDTWRSLVCSPRSITETPPSNSSETKPSTHRPQNWLLIAAVARRRQANVAMLTALLIDGCAFRRPPVLLDPNGTSIESAVYSNIHHHNRCQQTDGRIDTQNEHGTRAVATSCIRYIWRSNAACVYLFLAVCIIVSDCWSVVWPHDARDIAICELYSLYA